MWFFFTNEILSDICYHYAFLNFLNAETLPFFFFLSLNWCHFSEILACKVLDDLCSFGSIYVATCSSGSLQKKHWIPSVELAVKGLLNCPFCLPSTLFHLTGFFSSTLFWINTLCCWTLRSFSKMSINLIYKVLSSYDYLHIVKSHLVTLLVPSYWYILSIPYNFSSMPCSDVSFGNSVILLIIWLSASTGSGSLSFQNWLILLIPAIFFFRSNLEFLYAALSNLPILHQFLVTEG